MFNVILFANKPHVCTPIVELRWIELLSIKHMHIFLCFFSSFTLHILIISIQICDSLHHLMFICGCLQPVPGYIQHDRVIPLSVDAAIYITMEWNGYEYTAYDMCIEQHHNITSHGIWKITFSISQNHTWLNI